MQAAIVANNQLLPPEISASSGTWFGRARSYPIFSPAWYRYRSLSLLSGGALACLVLVAMLAAPMVQDQGMGIDWPGVAVLTGLIVVSFCVLCLAGPGMAVAVRRLGLRQRLETGVILLALLLGMVLSAGLLVLLAQMYQRPSPFDLEKDAIVTHKLPTIKITVQAFPGLTDYFPGSRHGTPISPELADALEEEYASLGLDPKDAPTGRHGRLPALDDMRKLDAGDPSIDKSHRADIEKKYAAAIEKMFLERQRSMAVFHSGSVKPKPMTQRQILAMEHTVALYPKPAPSVAQPLQPASSPDTLSRDLGRSAIILIALATLLLTCWLGGLFDLLAFVRQRGKLVDVLQREELQRAQAARNSAEMRLSVLAAQVEPHFLFNTLASVRSAISSDPQRAAQIVDHMVTFLRSTIPQMRDDAGSATVRLSTQLDSARAYLALMHERIARLQFRVDTEPGLENAAIPPLMLISLVENAVKHGVEPKIGQARIEVRARRNDAQLEVSVSDDGVGFGEAATGDGIGLANIQERLRSYYGQCASLTLKALPEGGVAAILRLPLSFES